MHRHRFANTMSFRSPQRRGWTSGCTGLAVVLLMVVSQCEALVLPQLSSDALNVNFNTHPGDVVVVSLPIPHSSMVAEGQAVLCGARALTFTPADGLQWIQVTLRRRFADAWINYEKSGTREGILVCLSARGIIADCYGLYCRAERNCTIKHIEAMPISSCDATFPASMGTRPPVVSATAGATAPVPTTTPVTAVSRETAAVVPVSPTAARSTTPDLGTAGSGGGPVVDAPPVPNQNQNRNRALATPAPTEIASASTSDIDATPGINTTEPKVETETASVPAPPDAVTVTPTQQVDDLTVRIRDDAPHGDDKEVVPGTEKTDYTIVAYSVGLMLFAALVTITLLLLVRTSKRKSERRSEPSQYGNTYADNLFHKPSTNLVNYIYNFVSASRDSATGPRADALSTSPSRMMRREMESSKDSGPKPIIAEPESEAPKCQVDEAVTFDPRTEVGPGGKANDEGPVMPARMLSQE